MIHTPLQGPDLMYTNSHLLSFLQACMTNLRQQLGYPAQNVVPDLTRAGMDYLALEREKLMAEQVSTATS